MIEIFILSLIQGITEFLPISSSSHLIIISEYLDFENQKLEIDVSLHIGSFFAVIVFFRSDIFNFIKKKDLFLKIIIGSIPVMVAGYLLVKFNLIDGLTDLLRLAKSLKIWLRSKGEKKWPRRRRHLSFGGRTPHEGRSSG